MAANAGGPPCSVCGRITAPTPATTGSAAGVFIHSSQDIPDPTAPAYWHQPDSDGRYRALIVLCPQHEQQLRDASAAGAVWVPTGVRWWLDGATT